jgi:hypothetical protein
VQPVKRQQGLPVGIRQREPADIQRQRERVEADFAHGDSAAVMLAYKVLQAPARVIRHGEKAGGGVRAEEHHGDGEADEMTSITAHGSALRFSCARILDHRGAAAHQRGARCELRARPLP